MRKRKDPPRNNRSNESRTGDKDDGKSTYMDHKKAKLDLVDEKDGVPFCIYFNVSKCNSNVAAGKKCKRAGKEFWHLCASKKNKSDGSSAACGKDHAAKDHK